MICKPLLQKPKKVHKKEIKVLNKYLKTSHHTHTHTHTRTYVPLISIIVFFPIDDCDVELEIEVAVEEPSGDNFKF